ncbi:hypothetical protein [Tardiphaga sp. 768_D3_N2_1]|uniref:hypothetical protein n=1 Tax=Tardiphaga sp. 768_D3_N2_1 TaxID=3240783 RepID=UPI003F8C6FEA
MIDRDAIVLAHQRKRGMRPDAHRYIRPDVARFLLPGTAPASVFPALDIKYSPTQRRIPAGQTGGGRWVDELVASGENLLWGGLQDLVGGGLANALGGALGSIGSSLGAGLGGGVDAAIGDASVNAGDSVQAFADTDTSNSWTDLIGNDLTTPVPIPNADAAEDIPANLEEVNARRGNSPNSYFPGASTQQLVRLDQAVARSENALTQIRQYDAEWRPSETSLRAPGSVEGAIRSAEARAAESETRLDQLRSGIGGNFPPQTPSPRSAASSPRVFDGGAWIDSYRGINNAPDLFGQAVWPADKGTVAVGQIDGDLYFGVNSTAPGYGSPDRLMAVQFRDSLISKYPFDMDLGNIGGVPNDGLFHAETTLLLRAASDHGGSLENRSIEIMVDREVCYSCGQILPKLGMELGNPYVVFVERDTGFRSEMWNGRWLSGRYKK